MKKVNRHSEYKKYGMVIDLDKCTGCGSCMVACMAENNVPFRKDESDKLLSITWLRVYKLTNGKPFPNTDICYLPRPCMHCEGQHEGHSPCVTDYTGIAKDNNIKIGIVSQLNPRSIVGRHLMASSLSHACFYTL